MITDAILGLLVGVAHGIVGALPEAEPLGMDGFGQAVAAMKALNAGLPVVETLAMGMMCLTIIGGIFVTRLLLMVYDRIPGKLT